MVEWERRREGFVGWPVWSSLLGGGRKVFVFLVLASGLFGGIRDLVGNVGSVIFDGFAALSSR